MTDYSKITALYSRLSVGDEDRDGGESNSIQNQKIFLENYARGQHLTNIRHYIDDDESGRFFDRSAYSRMMDDVENGKIGVCIMKDLTRWGRDYLQVGNAMEIFRRNNVRFIFHHLTAAEKYRSFFCTERRFTQIASTPLQYQNHSAKQRQLCGCRSCLPSRRKAVFRV